MLDAQLREAIWSSHHRRKVIAAAAGLHPAAITRFMKEQGSLSFGAVVLIAEFLNLSLIKNLSK